MSNYPSWWNTTVTVYNKYEDPETRQISWFRHTRPGCFFKYTGNKISVGETTLETDTVICRVPISTAFKESYSWNALSVKSGYFTFSPGDIVAKGIISDGIDEYTSGQRSSDFLKKHKKLQGCFVVNACSINTGEGRGLEHYYVRGV